MNLNLVSVLLIALTLCLSCAAAVIDGNSTVPDPLALSFGRQHSNNKRAAAYIHMELLLRQIVAECAKREDTVLQLDPQGQLQVQQKLPADAPCPALDIALRGSERGVGMCTDVALYLLHMGRTGQAGRGARMIPLLPAADMAAYNAKCTQTTARMFLESMYHEWVAPSASGGYHLMQVNSEHMFKVHEPLHKEIDVFLCKTQFCQQLLVQYVTQKGWKAEVWYMGHTSSDVLVSAPASSGSSSSASSSQSVSLDSSKDQDSHGRQKQEQSFSSQSSVSPLHADYNQFLHVQGKSGLKHTAQLLECWTQHPEFPMLTVIGQTSVTDDIIQKVATGSVKNVQLLPKPAQDELKAAAVRDMARRLAIAAAAPAAESTTAATVAMAAAPAKAAAAHPQAPAVADKAAATAIVQPAAGLKQSIQGGSTAATSDNRSSSSSSGLPTASTAKPAAGREPAQQFGRRRRPIQQPKQAEPLQQKQQKVPSAAVQRTAKQQQQQPEQLVTPPAKEQQKEQQQQQQDQSHQQPQTQGFNRPRQQAHQPATQFGRRRKRPTQQQQAVPPQQQQQQDPASASAAAAAVADSAELQQSKQKVLELFSTLGLSTDPVAATRQLLGSSTAATFAAMRRLFGSSSSSSSSSSNALKAVNDPDKEALRLAGKHLGWIPTAVDKDQLLGFDDVRRLQASTGVHICVSEREGFGHYLNEARAAGALLVSTDHPPMNELVQDGVSGVLVKPSRTGSYEEWQALGSFSPINAYLTASDVCSAVQRVLAMPVEQRRQLGLQARQQYLQDKAQFVQKLHVLRKTLHRWRMEGRYKPTGQGSTEDQ